MTANESSLRRLGSLDEALLSLLEVDNVPDGLEVLEERIRASARVRRHRDAQGTHVGLHVLVLQVEGVLPNVDTDNGYMSWGYISKD